MIKIRSLFLSHANAVFLAIVLLHYSLYQHVPVVISLVIGGGFAIASCFFLEKRWQIVVCLCVWFLSGYYGVRDATFHLDTPHVFAGKVLIKTAPEKTNSGSWRFVGEDLGTGSHYSVTLRQFSLPKLGDILTSSGCVDSGSPPRNPGASDSRDYLKRERLVGFLSLQGGLLVGRDVSLFGAFISDLRGSLILSTQKALPENYANLLIGLILGDNGISLDETWASWYRNLGLIHILVVSGSQVSLLGGICFLMLRPFRLKPLSLYLTMTLINTVFYALTGGGASIFRAILMTQIILYLKLIRQNTEGLDIVCTTALVMLLWDPALAFNLGAQLSFLATASLIFGVPVMTEKLKRIPESLREVTALAITPFLFTAPLIWHQFQLVSLLSPLANMLVLPLIEALVPIGFFCMGFNLLVPSLMKWPMQGCLGLMQGLNTLVSGMVSIGIKPQMLPRLDFLYMLLLYVGGYVAWWGKSNQRKYGLLLIVFVCFGVALTTWWPRAYYTVTYLDVGQGDATLIQTPYGKSFLIDAGNRVVDFHTGNVLWDVGQRIVLPALQYYGIRGLDGFILTHFDMDHIGGARSVVLGAPVKTLFTHFSPDLGKAGISESIHLVRVENPSKLVLDKGAYLLFFPFEFQRETDSENNRSVICQLVIGAHHFLFTGDLEAEGEAYLAAAYGESLRSDVYKAGHHGSRTSSTAGFLQYVQPDIAIISVGAKNRYGHPAKEVVARFESVGMRIYRTDRDGAVEIKTNGGDMWVKTYANP